MWKWTGLDWTGLDWGLPLPLPLPLGIPQRFRLLTKKEKLKDLEKID
jgi:hypothetical protein